MLYTARSNSSCIQLIESLSLPLIQDPNEGTVRAILGSVGEEDTVALSRASKRHEMPIMGYQSERGDLSDKVGLAL